MNAALQHPWLAEAIDFLIHSLCAAGHRPIYPATNDFTGFNVTQPPPFPTFALPPFYFTAYPNQTSSDPTSPNYFATYTGASPAGDQLRACICDGKCRMMLYTKNVRTLCKDFHPVRSGVLSGQTFAARRTLCASCEQCAVDSRHRLHATETCQLRCERTLVR